MSTRRSFLQKISAPLLIFPFIKPTEQLNNDEINQTSYDGPILRVAIMGLGSYGTRVAEAIQACTRAKLAGVISGTSSKITAWQSKYGIPEKNCYNYETFDA